MTEPPDYARLVAQVLTERSVDPPRQASKRDFGIGSVAQAIAERQRRRKLQRLLLRGGGALGVAAVIAFGFVAVGRIRAGEQPLGPAKQAMNLVGHAAARTYPPGSRIMSSAGPLLVDFGESTRLHLDDASEVEYRAETSIRRFRLVRGSLRLRVQKLSAHERFIVETRDAEIEVRGTEFEVTLLPEPSVCASATRVSVFEGVVQVRFEGRVQLLPAGESWPVRCPPADAVSARPSTTVSAAPADEAPSVAAKASGSMPKEAKRSKPPVSAASLPVSRDVAADEESELPAQNELYARAVAARRAGNLSQAALLYEQLMTAYPRSPLLESATIERLRLLTRLDRARAADAARLYLARFPHGYGRTEAMTIIGRP